MHGEASVTQQEDDHERFDQRESMRGYRTGLLGEICPENASYWFRIGWQNGRIDHELMRRLEEKPEDNFDIQK